MDSKTSNSSSSLSFCFLCLSSIFWQYYKSLSSVILIRVEGLQVFRRILFLFHEATLDQISVKMFAFNIISVLLIMIIICNLWNPWRNGPFSIFFFIFFRSSFSSFISILFLFHVWTLADYASNVIIPFDLCVTTFCILM